MPVAKEATRTGTEPAVVAKPLVLTTPTSLKESITFRGFKLNMNISESTPKATVLSTINQLCEAISANDALGERMRLVLGRLMAIVQDRRLYAPEFKRFEDFRMSIAEKYRLSRATVSAALGIARALPTVDPSAASHVPLTNLTLLARAAKHIATSKDAPLTPDQVSTLLKDAGEKPLKDFRLQLEQGKLIPARLVPDTGVIMIRTTAHMADFWKAFCADRDPAEVLGELIDYKPVNLTGKMKIRRR